MDYANYQAKADEGEKAKLSGFGIGFSKSPHDKHGFYAGMEFLKDDGLDIFQADTGYQYNFANHDRFYALGKAGIGFATLDIDSINQSNNFFTVPVGVEVGYSFTPNIAAYAGLGYQWSFDTTSDTTCRDGSQSNSTGSGTCS